MSQVNYAEMSDEELRHYFLRHREDKIALRVYLERLSDCSRPVITTVDDPDFEAKIQVVVSQQVQATNSNGEATT